MPEIYSTVNGFPHPPGEKEGHRKGALEAEVRGNFRGRV